MIENVCKCEQCKNNEYNISEYLVTNDDLKVLDKERPLGISGHLRVINEAMSIAECIDSCIDFFDELIITYNKSVDETEEILKNYEKKYPDKIKLFYYKPNILKFDNKEYNNYYSQIHYMDNYSNYGLVKIKYKYYLKIDADQIYFTEKLMEFRSFLLSEPKNINSNIRNLLIINKISWFISSKKLRNKFRTYFIKKFLHKDNDYIYDGLETILPIKDLVTFAKLNDKKYRFEFGGFNLNLKDDNIVLFKNSCINGCAGDTALFVPYSDTCYHFVGNNPCETFKANFQRYLCGFLWIHLGLIKRNVESHKEDIITVDNIQNTSKKTMLEYISNYDENSQFYFKSFINTYFDEDKKYATKDFCNKYLIKPLEYALKKRGKFPKRQAF